MLSSKNKETMLRKCSLATRPLMLLPYLQKELHTLRLTTSALCMHVLSLKLPLKLKTSRKEDLKGWRNISIPTKCLNFLLSS